MKCPLPSVLEALVLGELGGERRARVAAHGAVCPACARELAWLRAEQRLVQARGGERDPLPAFEAVLARSHELAPRHAVPWRASLALGLCAAAAAIALAGPRALRSGAAPRASVAAAPVEAHPELGAPERSTPAALAPAPVEQGVCWENEAPMSCAPAANGPAPSEPTCSSTLAECDCASCDGDTAPRTCDQAL